jgi:hypothetical protein
MMRARLRNHMVESESKSVSSISRMVRFRPDEIR